MRKKRFILWQLKNGETIDKFKEDSIYQLISRGKFWRKINKDYINIRNQYLIGINYQLLQEVQNICETDQLYRKSKMTSDTWTLQKSIDSLNFIKLKKIFSQYGFPSYKKIGNHTIRTLAGTDILTVIRHAPIEMLKDDFIPKIEQFVREGYCHPEDFAGIIDYYLLRQQQIPIYGTITNYDLKNQEANTDTKRRALGLYSMALLQERDKLIKIKYGISD